MLMLKILLLACKNIDVLSYHLQYTEHTTESKIEAQHSLSLAT